MIFRTIQKITILFLAAKRFSNILLKMAGSVVRGDWMNKSRKSISSPIVSSHMSLQHQVTLERIVSL